MMPRERAVCDESVAINFAKIRRLNLLFDSFDRLLVPREVFVEAVEKGLENKAPDARIIGNGVQNGAIAVKKARIPISSSLLG